jgi:hypothetical protein
MTSPFQHLPHLQFHMHLCHYLIKVCLPPFPETRAVSTFARYYFSSKGMELLRYELFGKYCLMCGIPKNSIWAVAFLVLLFIYVS